MSTQESKWCVFCGEDTRKKRKRDICDTYEEYKVDKIPSSLKKIYNKKYLQEKNLMNLQYFAQFVTLLHASCVLKQFVNV